MKRLHRVRAIRKYQGRTEAYSRFLQHASRSNILVDGSVAGIEAKRGEVKAVVDQLREYAKLQEVQSAPKDLFEARFDTSADSMHIRMGRRSAKLMLRATRMFEAAHVEARMHFYRIMVVDTWGAFETYVVTLLSELFSRKPELLASSEEVTVRDVIAHRTAIVDFLAEKQLERLGNMKLGELLDYLKKRLNLQLPATLQSHLSELYLVRNIVAHASGLVRDGLKSKLPKQIVVVKSELRVTKEYATRALEITSRAVTTIERHVVKKFYKNAAA